MLPSRTSIRGRTDLSSSANSLPLFSSMGPWRTIAMQVDELIPFSRWQGAQPTASGQKKRQISPLKKLLPTFQVGQCPRYGFAKLNEIKVISETLGCDQFAKAANQVGPYLFSAFRPFEVEGDSESDFSLCGSRKPLSPPKYGNCDDCKRNREPA